MPGLSSPRTRLSASLALVALLLLAGAVYWLFLRGTPQERLLAEIEREMRHIRTVEGRLTLSFEHASLQQELWVERPSRLRTETEAGPSAFQGTIVVLNEQEGWVYTPALGLATVVDRSGYRPDVAGEAGAGSLLERMPDTILAALRSGSPYHLAAGEIIAGRSTHLLELTIPPGDSTFAAGTLQVWLDDAFSYPLAWRDAAGRHMVFTEVAFNREIDPATFTFFPPPGASVHQITPEP